MGYPHKLLGANEHIEHELHPHWKELVFPAVLVPLIVGVGTYIFVVVGDRAHNSGRWATFGVVLIILLFGVVIPWLRWRTTLYVLTNERIITRQGILSRSGRDIPLSRVNDVSFSHNVIERVLKCGKLTVESAGERGQLVLRDVPNVEDVQRELYRLVDDFTNRRGAADDGTGSVERGERVTDEAEAVVALEEVLLGGPRRYTRIEVSELTGIPPEVGQRLWRALGFPDIGDDEQFFTDGDVEALRLLRQLEDVGLVETELAVTNARAMARQLATLADWQVGIFVERFLREAEAEPGDVVNLIPVVMEQIVPAVQQLVIYVWRRQLASAGGRLLATVGSELTDATLAVGFADLVGYTRLVRGLDEAELDRLIESFESEASDLVATRGGRVVKTIGDEVMFVADDVRTAVEIGVGLAETLHATDGPDVRVGIAWGPVLARLGDIYGSTVNLASRLTTIAKPGSVLLDETAANELDGDAAYKVKPIPRLRVRGLGLIEPHVVRRRVEK